MNNPALVVDRQAKMLSMFGDVKPSTVSQGHVQDRWTTAGLVETGCRLITSASVVRLLHARLQVFCVDFERARVVVGQPLRAGSCCKRDVGGED